MKAVLQQVTAALPGRRACSWADRTARDKKGEVSPGRPVIPKLAAIQRRVAGQVGCGYFDTRRDGRLRLDGDLGPAWARRRRSRAPVGRGAEVIGRWLYLALMDAYEGWKANAARP